MWGRDIVRIEYLLVRWERPYLMERSERKREREREGEREGGRDRERDPTPLMEEEATYSVQLATIPRNLSIVPAFPPSFFLSTCPI